MACVCVCDGACMRWEGKEGRRAGEVCVSELGMAPGVASQRGNEDPIRLASPGLDPGHSRLPTRFWTRVALDHC